MTRSEYVYVASSWRNLAQPAVVAALRTAGIDCYDFKNPEGGTGFSWSEVRPAGAAAAVADCMHCGGVIVKSSFAGLGFWEPDYDARRDPVVWRHVSSGYAACNWSGSSRAFPAKGSDWEPVGTYLDMIDHPRAIEGYESDFAAMNRADTFVMVLPCGKSAHLELGWAAGAGKRTAILCEDPIEPELMYRMADFIAPTLSDLLGWMGAGVW
jgi:hypothetical protein